MYSQRHTSGYTKKIDAERTAGSNAATDGIFLGGTREMVRLTDWNVFFLHIDIDL